nr:MAG TPA: hypothetical protein [Caudoviricetes sp.]
MIHSGKPTIHPYYTSLFLVSKILYILLLFDILLYSFHH